MSIYSLIAFVEENPDKDINWISYKQWLKKNWRE